MTTPRTTSGQAAISAMRPYLRRALASTILAIEAEAVAPYLEALREADGVLESLAAEDATTAWDMATRVDLVERAAGAHQLARPLLAEHLVHEQG